MFVALIAAALLTTQGPDCSFGGAVESWTRSALQSWDRLDQARIHMQHPITPTLLLFDQSCVYRFTPTADGAFRVGARSYSVEGVVHDGEISLPSGGRVPARKLSFAAPTDDDGMFFIMSLPEIWRADTREARDPDHLAMLVFMHEFAHTQQVEGLGRRIDDLIARGLPEDANDDSLQNIWSETPGYVSAYKSELALLYRSASAATTEERRALLAEASRYITARRDAFLEDQPLWREADDVFLTFEGSGNWAAWMWLTDPLGGGMSAEEATAFVRGTGRWWSQEAGLGLMLALEGLMPHWPSLTFGPKGVTAETLIARALQPSRSSE